MRCNMMWCYGIEVYHEVKLFYLCTPSSPHIENYLVNNNILPVKFFQLWFIFHDVLVSGEQDIELTSFYFIPVVDKIMILQSIICEDAKIDGLGWDGVGEQQGKRETLSLLPFLSPCHGQVSRTIAHTPWCIHTHICIHIHTHSGILHLRTHEGDAYAVSTTTTSLLIETLIQFHSWTQQHRHWYFMPPWLHSRNSGSATHTSVHIHVPNSHIYVLQCSTMYDS